VITQSAPTFTTISEKISTIRQQDKSVAEIEEVTHTIEPTQITFMKVDSAAEDRTIELEPRQGMFEYLFLYLDYGIGTDNNILPESDPIIRKLRFWVRGRENLFVKSLDGDDLAQISRFNCHQLCNWRELHESGRGILLHLADLGLTEELPFPKRTRIQLKVRVEDIEYPTQSNLTYDDLPGFVRFNVVQIRKNQLLSGDISAMSFEFLNEK
jgi:hypothetical protein